MMIESLNKKGYNAYAISIPSHKEIMTIAGLSAPVFITMMAKVHISLSHKYIGFKFVLFLWI